MLVKKRTSSERTSGPVVLPTKEFKSKWVPISNELTLLKFTEICRTPASTATASALYLINLSTSYGNIWRPN